MLDSPKPKNLKELIHFLQEKPDLKVQTPTGKKKTRFLQYENGLFCFESNNFNFLLHGPELREIGLTIGQKGFIVQCGNETTSYLYGA